MASTEAIGSKYSVRPTRRCCREDVEPYAYPPSAQCLGAGAGRRGGRAGGRGTVPKGKVLLSLTSTHGVDTGDILVLSRCCLSRSASYL